MLTKITSDENLHHSACVLSAWKWKYWHTFGGTRRISVVTDCSDCNLTLIPLKPSQIVYQLNHQNISSFHLILVPFCFYTWLELSLLLTCDRNCQNIIYYSEIRTKHNATYQIWADIQYMVYLLLLAFLLIHQIYIVI